MKVPISWLRDFVDLELPIEELAERLTYAGLEVEAIRYVGLPVAEASHAHTSVSGLAWDPEKIVVGEILEVMPHPNADRLVLTRLNDGTQEHTVLTGAPNLLELRSAGPLERPLKVAYAKQGARIFDGKQAGWEEMILEPIEIRGVESSSMACSEKELGISEEHGGIIMLDDDAEAGIPLVEYMGDAVLDIDILPNIARNANILGVARETAAVLGIPLKESSYEVDWSGLPIAGRVELELTEPELNPRFVLGLVEDVKVGPSPYWVQRRLRLAGMRPINNIVDATNYVMLEVGEPLHAFDYDLLLERSEGSPPTIITRLPGPDETLTTLDGVERKLDDFTILVADTTGALSIGGVMGGAETEVGPTTSRVLLEGAAWNFINIRKTVAAQKLSSEAAYRFERGVHPAMAEHGVRRGLEVMRQLTGGTVAEGLVDMYPLPPDQPEIELGPEDIERWLGIQLETDEIASVLERLQFSVEIREGGLSVVAPDHRLDIGRGVVGVADLVEEIARIYGYDRIPESQIADRIPPQYGNLALDLEERIRDLLAGMGLQEVVTYRLTSPEREARASTTASAEQADYVRISNPITEDRVVLRRSLIASVLEVAERNRRLRDRIALFEIGPVFLPQDGEQLPKEPGRLAILLTGQRSEVSWQAQTIGAMDFYDLKGIIMELFGSLHLAQPRYQSSQGPLYHPGKCAELWLDGISMGTVGEVHPVVSERYGFETAPLVIADLDLDAILSAVPERYPVQPVPAFPAVLEDLAFIVAEDVPAEQMRVLMMEEGYPLVHRVTLFDLYRGEQIGKDKKSLAFSLVFQAMDRTLTDEEVAEVRRRIAGRLEREIGAILRER
jgi:phenylalanyl-tRNA synthetase beta chain